MQGIDDKKYIFGTLFRLGNELESIGNKMLSCITVKQWFLLAVLSSFFDAPPTLSELAEKMGSSRQNVKQLALKLEKKGFLKILPDEEDARALRVVLGPSFPIWQKAHGRENEEFLEMLFAPFSPGELHDLKTGLAKLDENARQALIAKAKEKPDTEEFI